MAMGEWLSVNSVARALPAADRHRGRRAGAVARGGEGGAGPDLPGQGPAARTQAKALAERLLADKDTALDTLAREELGIDPDELGGSAWAAAAASFCLFAFGAIFPVAPFVFLQRLAGGGREPGPERRGAGRDRRGDLAVHRSRRRVLGVAAARDRLRRPPRSPSASAG